MEADRTYGIALSDRSYSVFSPIAVAGDLLIAIVSLYAAFVVRLRVPIPGTISLLPPESMRFNLLNALLVGVAQIVGMSFFGLYRTRERFREPLARVVPAVLAFQLFALAAIYFLAQPYSFPRSVLVLYLVVDGILLAIWRVALDRVFPQRRRRALVVGAGSAATLISETIRRHPWAGVELVGIVGDGNGSGDDLKVLGSVDQLNTIAEREFVDEIILTPEDSSWRDRISETLPAGGRADILVWPSPFETMIGRLRFRMVGDLPLLEAKVRPLEGVHAFAKRTFDLAIAIPLLLLTSPILVIAGLLIAATSAGGVFYRQTRIGKDGCPFELWKLRTMRRGAEGDSGAVLASRGDPRITPLGRILRAARIDEIPQLWNVAKGDMSLVGPRPERPEFTEPLGRAVPGYSLRHAVRPGLTGLAQISGGYSTEPEIKLRYDLAYLNNWSLGLDLSILLRTLPVILTRRGV
ncbi:MAG TPA: sugar transferase [Thermoanaerobaculia bacterium]|nr:sugar transferase [Thermoanaerobaculia bacterium]